MKDLDVSQGVVVDPDTGRIYPIPAGGSADAPPPASDGGGDGGGGGEVQPTSDAEPQSQPQGGGQEFIAPYLEEVPEEHRDVVAPVLEKFRADQDAQVNKRFEEQANQLKQYQQYGDPQQLELATALYESLITDPLATLDWVAERFEEEAGRDLRTDLRSHWYDDSPNEQTPAPEGQQPSSDDDKPLTRAELEAELERRQKAAQAEATRQQQIQQARERTMGWIDDAAKRHGLDLESDDGTLRQAVIMRASQLKQEGKATSGQQAVDAVVESLSKRLSPSNAKANGQPDPNVASGGTAPPQENVDLSDEKARRAYMTDRFLALTGQQAEE